MLFIIFKVIILTLLAPFCVGIVRKVKALMQNRKGASVFQPYADLWKLFHKDEVVSKDASWIFLIVPYLVFGISMFVLSAVPLVGSLDIGFVSGDFLTILFTLALGTFFLALAGIDIGSPFGGFGSSREMTLAALAEGILIFSIVPVAFLTNTANIASMALLTADLPMLSYIVLFLAFAGFVVALFAETGRIPFDNAATHLELTMIHEAMILEYSGKRLALIEWANANKMLFFSLIGANLFFPFGLTTQTDIFSMTLALTISLVKTVFLLVGVAFVESIIAKYRFFRLPDILLTGFLFSLLALFAITVI